MAQALVISSGHVQKGDMMKTLAELKKMIFVPHHDCGCCGAMVGWHVSPDMHEPYFDPSCDCGCSDGYYGTYEEVFKWYNTVFEEECEEAVQTAWEKEEKCDRNKENEKLLNESIHKMIKISSDDDEEMAHINADNLLCEVLHKLGFGELVNVYERVKKWYS